MSNDVTRLLAKQVDEVTSRIHYHTRCWTTPVSCEFCTQFTVLSSHVILILCRHLRLNLSRSFLTI